MGFSRKKFLKSAISHGIILRERREMPDFPCCTLIYQDQARSGRTGPVIINALTPRKEKRL